MGDNWYQQDKDVIYFVYFNATSYTNHQWSVRRVGQKGQNYSQRLPYNWQVICNG